MVKASVGFLAALCVLAPLAAALAEDADCCCPRCHVVCVPHREVEQEKHTAFDVECKWICVPKIRFPWEKCCAPKCAWVRKVKTLKKIEYECPHCKYTWTTTCECPTCPSSACPAGPCAAPYDPAANLAPPPAAASVEHPASPAAEPGTSRRLFAPLERLFGR